MIFSIITNYLFNNKTHVKKSTRLKIEKEEKDKELQYKTDVYLNRTKSNIKTNCPISSYKQCSNNFNRDHPIENVLSFKKPLKENRVNMWNSID